MTYDPRLLHDDPWKRLPQQPIDLPRGTLSAHRLDHSPPWHGDPPKELLEKALRGVITDEDIDRIIEERRKWAKQQHRRDHAT